MNIHHIDLTVSDIRKARDLYIPVLRYLGYEVVEDGAEDLGFAPKNRQGPGIVLHIARLENRGRRHDRHAPGLHHLAFAAANRAEVDGLHELLKEINAEILDPPAVYYEPDYYAVFFADPDGIKLELVHKPGGY